ncbi:hypothetical protein OSTOST_19957, partial [Ostertagia ostertagi]
MTVNIYKQVPPNFFNATMTYRRDSRYFFPYGQFVSLNSQRRGEDPVTVSERKPPIGSIFPSRTVLCNDYITEKFYRRISQLLIPVVMKRKFYE